MGYPGQENGLIRMLEQMGKSHGNLLFGMLPLLRPGRIAPKQMDGCGERGGPNSTLRAVFATHNSPYTRLFNPSRDPVAEPQSF